MDVKLPYDILSYKEEFFDATELSPELASKSLVSSSFLFDVSPQPLFTNFVYCSNLC